MPRVGFHTRGTDLVRAKGAASVKSGPGKTNNNTPKSSFYQVLGAPGQGRSPQKLIAGVLHFTWD